MDDEQKRVPGEGPTTARICIVGEAPGETEEKEGRPFVGQAGRVLDGLLEEVGIARDACYITNISKYRLTNNDFSTIPPERLEMDLRELQEELMLVRPNVLVLLGNEAMQAVLGHKGISYYRGSVLESKYGKCIPTYHPAAIAREWTFRPISVVDWEKVKRESGHAEINRTRREITVVRSFDDCIAYLNNVIANPRKLAFDIEVETEQITCIGFADSPTYAVTIPFWFGSSGSFWTEEEEMEIWRLIKQVLEDPNIPKIAQNAQYDMTVLRDKYGVQVRGLWLDTMIAFHSVYPELPKGLDLLCSIYTDVPYYKGNRLSKDMDEFFRYNGTDAVVTYECAEKIYKEMEEFHVKDFYYEHMHSLITPIMDITRVGVRIDSEKKKQAIESYKEIINKAQEHLDVLVGHPLNPNSPKQMQEWLYKELKLPTKYKLRKVKGEKTVTADEEALDELYAEFKLPALKVIIDIREHRKVLSTYLEARYDKEKDGTERARCSYLITGTETGRLSSRETVYGTGTNLQNVPKGIAREIFVPNNGCVFVNADLSQAEARVVAYLAGEERLIKVFENGGDIHRKNASNIFRVPVEAVTSAQRELAKRTVHASHYGMGPITFAKEAGIPVAEAKRLLNQYFAEYPRIKLWHMSTESYLRKSRIMTTPFGRKRTFFNRWDKALVKEGLAYVPQSTVADLLNMGLRRFYEATRGTRTQILLQIHDAILCQTPVECVTETCKSIREALTILIRIGQRELLIPCDVSVGENWDNLRKI